MNDKNSLGILFFIRKERASDEKKAAIYLRITVNGKRAELSIKREVEILSWNSKGGCATGRSEAVKELNSYIDMWKHNVYRAQKQIMEAQIPLTADDIKNRLLGKTKNQKTLVEVFEYHNMMLAEKINIDHAPATLKRYETTLTHVKTFLKEIYKQDDILISQLNYKFAADFEHYFITVRKCNQNSTSKYIKNLKRIVHLALKNEWIDKDPFVNFKAPIKPVDRDFLTPEDLKKLEDKEISVPRLDLVRDIFVFSCYTGLAFIDVYELTNENISKGIDGELWLLTHRHKTDTASNVPLLSKAIEIIEKYKDHPAVIQKGSLLPVLTNQKVNAYLKEIAIICDISKNLTFHLARHTFATTVTLTNGVPIETVSKLLGHTNIRTTQIYAKVIEKKVSEDMNLLKTKLNQKIVLEKTSNQ